MLVCNDLLLQTNINKVPYTISYLPKFVPITLQQWHIYSVKYVCIFILRIYRFTVKHKSKSIQKCD